MATSFESASSQWILSSQRAADLYSSGAKLWTKIDLRAIEEELAESYTRTSFMLRRFDGTAIHINNPLYGVERPIWRPVVKFQEYWRLVRVKPDTPPETYHCSYLVDWENESQELFDGFIENYEAVFQQKRQLWNDSSTCTLFKTRIRQLLGTDICKVSKVVCFGLGDMTRRPQPWWRYRNSLSDKPETEANCWEDSMMQHCMALTLADVVRHHTAGTSIRLLTQDP
ncbi:uncharacterized protein DNG_08116 [Cephalotrichum gorgonifer]|uniref:Uncharacterized protein n=1 Tax=Cephalotrichum gorgonifer TaxID=2041049 RepID=A0AAE8SY34_9PEZI|nr:uncharacterized protein DNG_08116 [Cephalotrichum gorgonifer]